MKDGLPAAHVTSSEEELFHAVRAGTSDSWEKMVARYAALVYAVPKQMGLSQADAEEVSQTTWMVVYRHLHLIEKPRSLANWLITTASREAWKLQRTRSSRERIESTSARLRGDTPGEDPSEALERLEQVQMIRDAIDALPERCAKLLRALYLEKNDSSYVGIGKSLGMPQGSIGPTRLRCLSHLARILHPLSKP